MARHCLIDEYLAELAAQLPGELVDELADGLEEAYRQHLARAGRPEAAAAAAISEFGDPAVVVDAFVAASPGRRAARVLLITGPPVGLLWGLALLTAHAWTWSVPPAARAGFAAALVAVIVAAASAAFTGHHYRRTNLVAAGAGAGLVVLDATMLSVAVLVSPAPSGLLTLAVLASVIRIGLTARAVPASLTG